jgi:hypothetical protein
VPYQSTKVPNKGLSATRQREFACSTVLLVTLTFLRPDSRGGFPFLYLRSVCSYSLGKLDVRTVDKLILLAVVVQAVSGDHFRDQDARLLGPKPEVYVYLGGGSISVYPISPWGCGITNCSRFAMCGRLQQAIDQHDGIRNCLPR